MKKVPDEPEGNPKPKKSTLQVKGLGSQNVFIQMNPNTMIGKKGKD